MSSDTNLDNDDFWWKCVKWGYALIFCLIVAVSCSGKYCSIRKLYIKVLLKVFELSMNKTCHQKYSFEDKDSNSSYEISPNISTCSNQSNSEGFQLKEVCQYATSGMEAITEDSVIPHFVSERLPCWNLLSRNSAKGYEFISVRLTIFWIIGFFVRYGLLLPIRLTILLIGIIIFTICTAVIGCLPKGDLKLKLNAKFNIACFDFVAGCLSLVATFHNSENLPKNGIAVANHTSPIDSLVLATDNFYDMVGQKHGGIIGYFMWILSRSSSHIWFERDITMQRQNVRTRLREHVSDENLPPVLIFPEGVCVNNTSVMQFKKGVFEIDTEIFPMAVKFDPRFGDAFWWQDYFSSYILCMMTSWAIVCDVWYLPPVRKRPDENAIQFANRVKATIAAKAGLFDGSWDGFLKSRQVKTEWKDAKKLEFASYLVSSCPFLNEGHA